LTIISLAAANSAQSTCASLRMRSSRGELLLGGAFAEPADRALLVFRAESPGIAESFAQNDPYVVNGLVKRWEVRPWTVVVGGTEAGDVAATAVSPES
jgi:uncharacterized protein YciI